MFAVWEWLDDGGWVPYPAAVSADLEAASQRGDAFCALPPHRSTSYEVDFAASSQRNLRTGYARPVRRVR